MARSMAHRGPDGEGVKVFGDSGAGLGHRRLAIIDPTPAGAQPMSFANRWWITYNGEQYNFRELRSELEAKGERFSTNCDTEVLLRMFALHGPAMLERLNGIFAFAIWDERERRMFLARDRLGVKPLYYSDRDGVVGFASEIRALLPLLGRAELDHTALADYLTLLWVPDPRTAFKGIRKLPPGHFAWIDRNGLDIHGWWDLRFETEERPEEEWRERVREVVSRSVRRQLVSDVPLGSFLSGGVDSSAIVAEMAKHDDTVNTYTVAFAGEDLRHEHIPDDAGYARRVAELFGADHHERVLSPDVLELLPKAVWHLEEPVGDPAAISTYLVCSEASQRMKVMLSGMGADELFAGYPRHLAYRLSRLGDALPKAGWHALEAGMSRVARPGRPGRLRGPRRNLWKFMRAAGREPAERYLSFSSYYTTTELADVLSPELRADLDGYEPLDTHRAHLDRAAGGDDLSQLLYLDAKTFLPCLNLAYTDKMSMAASVEARVPLIDDELVALAARIPSNLKLRAWRRKYIFKRSQEQALPSDILWRRKAGFGAPVRSWLEGGLAPMVDDLLAESTLRERGLVDPAAVQRLRADNTAGRADNSLQLYALLGLELWCRTFLDRTW
ncbi:MAG TPA: asparagine synthase (glutamine-hydrolyzing), partial [Thermoleophilaceae bacterium]|nr:asparagine synthase (glutamine-hydrolyzing) [Thermoleophilaceae bacterium]